MTTVYFSVGPRICFLSVFAQVCFDHCILTKKNYQGIENMERSRLLCCFFFAVHSTALAFLLACYTRDNLKTKILKGLV